MNWFDKKADGLWVKRIAQENNAWAQHTAMKYSQDEPYIYRYSQTNSMRSSVSDGNSLRLSTKLTQKQKKRVDPDDINSGSDDEILYPGMSKKEVRFAKLKKRDQDIASQVFLGHKGRKIFQKAQVRNSHIVPATSADQELGRLNKSQKLLVEKQKRMQNLHKMVQDKYQSQRPSEVYQNPDSLSSLSNIESLKERRSLRRNARNLKSSDRGSVLSGEASLEMGRQSQIQNLAQDEYYNALKAFQTENSHRTIETNYQTKKRQKSETTKSGVYDFQKNKEKPNNQLPEKEREIQLTEIPKTYQKQLIDQIVREMTNEKIETLYKKKQQEKEKEKNRNSKSQQ